MKKSRFLLPLLLAVGLILSVVLIWRLTAKKESGEPLNPSVIRLIIRKS